MQEALYDRLQKEIQRTRLISCLATISGLAAMCILGSWMQSAIPIVTVLMVGAVYLFSFSLAFFIGSLLSRFETTTGGGDTITVYRGNHGNVLYINGQERDRTHFLNHQYYLEGQLSDGSTVTVAFARWHAFRITFSNGQPPVEF